MNKINIKQIILNKKIQFLNILILTILTTFLSLFPVILIQKIINLATGKEGIKPIIYNGLLYLSLHALNSIIKGFSNIYIKSTETLIGNEIRKTLFESIIYMKKKNTLFFSSSELLVKSIEDAKIVVNGFVTPFISIFSAVISFIYGLYLMLDISWELTLIIFPIGLFSTYFVRKNGKNLELTLNSIRENSENLWGIFYEAINGLSEIKANNKESYYINNLDFENNNYKKSILKGSRIKNKVNIFNGILFMFVIGIIMISGAVLVNKSIISIGSLVALMMYNSLLIDPIFNGINFYMNLKNVNSSVKRLNNILELKKEYISEAKRIENFTGDLNLKNVSFKINNNEILNDINFNVKKGEKIAIVGKSGAGKSTLFNLLLGFYEATEGTITYSIDKIMTKKNKVDIRKHISIVLQENFIFNGTIRDNLLFNNSDLSDKEMNTMLDIVEFSPKYNNSSNILDIEISNSKGGLSGGEKKKIQIARALAKKSDILFFDELTTSLDNISIEKILKNIDKNYPNKTMIFIDHRLEYTKNVDCILFLKNGNITEKGTHEELMKKKADYSRLYNGK